MSEQNPSPSYWSTVPYPVLSSRTLSDKTKLVYGVIASLTQAKDEQGEVVGYCYASNAYLADIMGCGERTITRSIADLVEAGELIVKDVGTNKTACKHQRRIYTLETYARSIVKNGKVASFGEAGIVKNGEAVFNRIDKKSNDITPKAPTGGEAESMLMFDRFWRLYPRKVNKQAAQRAWLRLAPDMLLCSEMSLALKRQIASEQWQRDGGRYIPYPASWLNGRRWEDELPPDTPQRPPDEPQREEAFGVWH